MTPHDVLDKAGYKIQVDWHYSEEDGFVGFVAQFPDRILQRYTPATPANIYYNIIKDDEVKVDVEFDVEADEEIEGNFLRVTKVFKAPSYAHRTIIAAELAQSVKSYGFDDRLIAYDDNFVEEEDERQLALEEVLDEFGYTNSWKARRAAKKAGVKEGFKAFFKFVKERKVQL